MSLLNRILTRGFDGFFWAFQGVSPIWPLLAVSLVAGVLMLWIFGKVSNQDRIRTVRDQIRGNLIGVRLFGDDVGVLFRLLGRILRYTGTYLVHAFVPMLIMMVPVLLILIQLALRFDHDPLAPGQRTVVTAKVRGGAPLGSVQLVATEGLEIETPPVRAQAIDEVAWRIRAESPGVHTLRLVLDGEELEKQIVVGEGWRKVSIRRTGDSWLDVLLHPGEAAIPSSRRLAFVAVEHDKSVVRVLGFELHWLLIFFVASIAFGFAFRKPLGVEI